MCKTLKMEIPAEHDLLFFKSSKNGGREKKENNQAQDYGNELVHQNEKLFVFVRQTCVCVRCMKFQRVV